MKKQDRQGVRSPADLERKYNFDKNLSDSSAAAIEANKNASEAYSAVIALDTKLNQEELVKRLTKDGEAQGILLIDGQIFVNASFVQYADGITFKSYIDSVEAQAVYTAIMTDTLLEGLTMKEKIANWYTMGLWSETMVNNAVEKGVLTEDEAAEIIFG